MKCQDCNREMTSKETRTCNMPFLVIDKGIAKRDTSYYDMNERCHDCGIENKNGNVHHFGCDVEKCPICEGQLISCGCMDYKDCHPARNIK